MNIAPQLSFTMSLVSSLFFCRQIRDWLSKRRRISHGATALHHWICRDRCLLQDTGLLWCDVAYGSSDKPDTGL